MRILHAPALAFLAGSALLTATHAIAQEIPGGPSPVATQVQRAISPQSLREMNHKLVSFGTRHTLSATEGERGVGAARRWIKSHFESFNAGINGGPAGALEVSLEEFTAPKGVRIPEPTKVANVVAVLKGSSPESSGRLYYVVGHYDSMPTNVMDAQSDAPGANDDASGTVAVMEIARVLAKTPLESTVVFLCTVGEEQGLVGARYHAETAAAKKADIRGVLNNDIVGDPWGPNGNRDQSTPTLIRVLSEGLPRNPNAEQLARIRQISSENDSPSRQLARYIVDVSRREATVVQPMLVFRQDRFMRGGDHIPFNDAGFAAVRFTEVHEDYRHQHQTPRIEIVDGKEVQFGDLPDSVDFDYLANVTRLNAAVLVNLANAPSSPENVRIITAKLDVTTTLRWSKSPEFDVAGYELVWRDTTSPTWQHSRDVGDATEVTVSESKDNFFFGVRAYDRDGYRSPVTFAGAAKE
ncbi:MAG TPA: M28 family metallopeptidase [Phycisphaerales bacterium]|nr:M28 family metallopeptidase [Phycisphaerales bacterium]